MTPRPAATLLLVRDGVDGIEVVMGRRPSAGFFGGAWVFPGGAVDDADRRIAGDGDTEWRLAALRETAEEVGILFADPPVRCPLEGDLHAELRSRGSRFDVERLVYLSNWVTPSFVPRRFDTRFYLATVDDDVEPRAATDEFEEVAWVSVRDALARHEAGDFSMIFPTVKHLEYLARFATAADVEREARTLDVIPQIEPTLIERGGDAQLVVGNDPRFGT